MSHPLQEINAKLCEIGYYLKFATTAKKWGMFNESGINGHYQLVKVYSGGPVVASDLALYGNYYCCGHGSVAGFVSGSGSGLTSIYTVEPEVLQLFYKGIRYIPSRYLKGCIITCSLDGTQKFAAECLDENGWKQMGTFLGLHGTPVHFWGANKEKEYDNYPLYDYKNFVPAELDLSQRPTITK